MELMLVDALNLAISQTLLNTINIIKKKILKKLKELRKLKELKMLKELKKQKELKKLQKLKANH